MSHQLFVYGSLRPGMERSYAGKVVEATHQLKGHGMFYYKYGGYPYLKPVKGKTVVGNLLTVSDKDLLELDQIEGVSRNMLKRKQLTVVGMDGTKQKAFVYVLGGLKDGDSTVDSEVVGGDWVKFQQARQSRRVRI